MAGESDLLFTSAESQLFPELGHGEELLDGITDFEGVLLSGGTGMQGLGNSMSQGMAGTAFEPMSHMPDDDQLFHPLDASGMEGVNHFSSQDKPDLLPAPPDGELSVMSEQGSFHTSPSPVPTSGPIGSPYSTSDGAPAGDFQEVYMHRSLTMPGNEQAQLPSTSSPFNRNLSMPAYATVDQMNKLTLSQAQQQQASIRQVPAGYLPIPFPHSGQQAPFQEGPLMYPPSSASKRRHDFKLGMPTYMAQVAPVPVERALASANTRRLTPIAPNFLQQQHMVPPTPPISHQPGAPPQIVKTEDPTPGQTMPSPGRADSGGSAGSTASDAKNGRTDTATKGGVDSGKSPIGSQGMFMSSASLLSTTQAELLGGVDANGDGLRPLPLMQRPQKLTSMQRSHSSHALGGLRTLAPAPSMGEGTFPRLPQVDPRLPGSARIPLSPSEAPNASMRPMLSMGMMRRVHSTGDLQTLNGMMGFGGQGLDSMNRGVFDDSFKVGRYSLEERKLRISRYRQKRSERNFNKKIKYACRKTLADSRPRIRGRFAKNDEVEEVKKENESEEEEEPDVSAEDEMLMLADYDG